MGASGEFSIHPEDMQAVAPTFSRESTRLNDALNALQRALDGLGAPWGDDKQGQQFGSAYSPQHDALAKAMGVLVQGLESIHDGLSAHADNHVQHDQATADGLKH